MSRGCIMCVSVAAAGDAVAPGSEKRMCADCGTMIWVAQSGLARAAADGLDLACHACTLKRMSSSTPDDPAILDLRVTPEQRAELREYYRQQN